MKRKQFVRQMESAGWSFVGHGGEHDIYEKTGQQFPVPRHSEVSVGIVRSWTQLNKQIDKEEDE